MKKVNIKKFLVLFSLLVCVFCMTACDSSNGTISTTSAKLEYDYPGVSVIFGRLDN